MGNDLSRELKLLFVLLRPLPGINALPFGWAVFVPEFLSFLPLTGDGHDVETLGYAAQQPVGYGISGWALLRSFLL